MLSESGNERFDSVNRFHRQNRKEILRYFRSTIPPLETTRTHRSDLLRLRKLRSRYDGIVAARRRIGLFFPLRWNTAERSENPSTKKKNVEKIGNTIEREKKNGLRPID